MLNTIICWIAEKFVTKYYKPKIPTIKMSIEIDGIDVAIGELPESLGRQVLQKYLVKKEEIEKYIDSTVYKHEQPYCESTIYLDVESDSKFNVCYSWDEYFIDVDLDNDAIVGISGGD